MTPLLPSYLDSLLLARKQQARPPKGKLLLVRPAVHPFRHQAQIHHPLVIPESHSKLLELSPEASTLHSRMGNGGAILGKTATRLEEELESGRTMLHLLGAQIAELWTTPCEFRSLLAPFEALCFVFLHPG